MASEKGTWADALAKVVRGQNAAPTTHLSGSAPNDVKDNDVLQFRLKEQGADDRDHNVEINEKRAAQLKRDGAFRVEQPVTKFERSFKPRFSDEVHKVAHIDGGRVTDTKGAVHPTKFVHPVPATSANTQPRDQYVRRGSAQVDAKRRQILQPFVNTVLAEIRKAGGTLELWRLGSFLKKRAGFAIASRQAGLSQASVIASFLRTFPARFKLDIPQAGGTASVSI